MSQSEDGRKGSNPVSGLGSFPGSAAAGSGGAISGNYADTDANPVNHGSQGDPVTAIEWLRRRAERGLLGRPTRTRVCHLSIGAGNETRTRDPDLGKTGRS